MAFRSADVPTGYKFYYKEDHVSTSYQAFAFLFFRHLFRLCYCLPISLHFMLLLYTWLRTLFVLFYLFAKKYKAKNEAAASKKRQLHNSLIYS